MMQNAQNLTECMTRKRRLWRSKAHNETLSSEI